MKNDLPGAERFDSIREFFIIIIRNMLKRVSVKEVEPAPI